MKKGEQFFAAIALMLISATAVAARSEAATPEASSLLRAISAIRAQERAVRNITISALSTMHGQQYDIRTKKWVWCSQPLNRNVMSATFDGSPHGMFRADVPMQWVIGNYGHLAQIVVDSFRLAYNGRAATYLQTAVASVGSKKLFPYNHGWVSGKMPIERDIIDGSTAWDDSIFGFTGDQPTPAHPRFSRYVSPGQKGITVSSRWTIWKGKDYLQVMRIGPPLGKDVFMLDPRKRFSIARYEQYGWRAKRLSSGKVRLTLAHYAGQIVRVRHFLEPQRGVFYPREVLWKVVGPRGGKIFSGEVDVSKVVVNDPHVNANTYVVRFPRGALIQDKSTGRYIRIGGTPEQQLKEIEAAVKAAR